MFRCIVEAESVASISAVFAAQSSLEVVLIRRPAHARGPANALVDRSLGRALPVDADFSDAAELDLA